MATRKLQDLGMRGENTYNLFLKGLGANRGGSTTATDGMVIWTPATTLQNLTSDVRAMGWESTNLRIWDGSSWSTLNGGGGGGIPSWETIYTNDSTFAITSGTWTISQSSANAILTLNKTNVSTGAVIDITNSGSGADLKNGSSWSILASGGVGVLELGSTGTINATGGALTIGASATATTFAGTVVITGTSGTVFTITQGNTVLTSGNLTLTSGNVVLTSGNLTLTAGATSLTSTSNSAATVLVTNNTATTYGAGGVSTGLVQFISTSLTSGTFLHIQTAGATMTSGNYLRLWDTTTGAAAFSVARYGATIIAGNASGTSALTLTIGDAVLSDGQLSVTRTGDNAVTLTAVNNTVTTASSIVFSGSGVFTGTTTTSFMTLTASGLTTGTVLYVPAAALTTGKVLHTVANAMTTGAFITASSTSAVLTSGAFAAFTWNPATYTGAGITTAGLVSITDAPTISTSIAGTHNDLNVTRTNTTAASAITYTVSGALVYIENASPTVGATSTLTDSAIVLDVRQSNTATSAGVVAAFTQSAGAGSTNAVTIVANSVTTSSGVLSVTANGLTTGKGLLVTSSGTITTTGSAVSIVANSATTSTGVFRLSATALTTGFCMVVTGGGSTITSAGGIMNLAMGAATDGSGIALLTSGAYTGTVGLINITANSLTTTGVALTISNTGTGLTSGSLISVTTGTTGAVATNGVVSLAATGNYTSTSNVGLLTLLANSTTAGTIMSVFGNALTTGVAALLSGTGVYTGTGFFTITQSGATTGTVMLMTANAVTTGNLISLSGTGLTTGVGVKVTAAAATMTTGAYFQANDGSVNVFSVGLAGHIQSRGTAPSIAVNTQNGITNAAIAASNTDTAGTITTTGTSTGGTIIIVTFTKSYAFAPKVILQAANANGANPNSLPYVTSTTTTFTITIPTGGTYAATPSWHYMVLESGSST